MYVAVKGGEKAIAAAHALLARERRGDVQIPEVTLEQLAGQLKLAVDRIMAEGSLYSPELAALAFKQAQGDAVEAIFLLRAYRTTLPRFGVSEPMDTSRMRVKRRISATWKDLPGGQILGSTFDYTHRLLDRGLAVPGTAPRDVEPERTAEDLAMMAADAQALLQEPLPRAMDALGREGLMESVAPSHEGNDCCRPTVPGTGPCACNPWPVPMKAFCWAWPIPPSAVTALSTPSPGNCAAVSWS